MMLVTWRKPRPDNFSLAFRRPLLVKKPLTAALNKSYVTTERGEPSLWGALMKRCLFFTVMLLGVSFPAYASTSVFNCSSFASSGACAAVQAGYGNQSFIIRNGGYLSGNQINFVPANSGHNGYGMSYYTPVNVSAFNTTFTFVPNGQNISFIVQNTTDQPGYQGSLFSSGAGCEAGFYQAFVQPPALVSPNNVFALEFDSGSWLTLGAAAFTYSSVQVYQQNQSPCLPNDSGPNYVATNKISTSPVALNSPSNAQYTTTGHVYSATVNYDGTDLTLSMYDQTAGGSCPGASCFTHSWAVNIPSMVNGSTAYVGFSAGINIPNLPALYVKSWNFSEGSTAGTSGGGGTSGGSGGGTAAQVATPQFSPGAGTYSASQTVSITDSTPNASVYYTTDGSTPTSASSKYTGAISVDATEKLQAVAMLSGDTNSSLESATYTITPSAPSQQSSEPINFPNGFGAHPSQLWMGGSAGYSGSALELTNSGENLANNVWYKSLVGVQAFTTTFTWTAICAKGATCGDGLGFMIIGASNGSSSGYNYSGRAGDQLAWSRCNGSRCPSMKSVLVKFDLFNNATGSGGANLTGFYSGGELPQLPNAQYSMSPSGINIQSGHLMKATLTYTGSVLMESITDTVTGATYRNSYSANIPALVGGNTAYVGFGGSSGGAVVTQNLESWTYTVE